MVSLPASYGLPSSAFTSETVSCPPTLVKSISEMTLVIRVGTFSGLGPEGLLGPGHMRTWRNYERAYPQQPSGKQTSKKLSCGARTSGERTSWEQTCEKQRASPKSNWKKRAETKTPSFRILFKNLSGGRSLRKKSIRISGIKICGQNVGNSQRDSTAFSFLK